MFVCGFHLFSNWRVCSEDSCCYHRFFVCVCVLLLFLVFCDYQSGLRLMWVEKSGLGWKKQALPGICSASLVTLAAAGVQAEKTRLSVMLSSIRQTELLLRFPSNGEKAENLYCTVKCDTHTKHTNGVKRFLFWEKYLSGLWTVLRKCFFRQNIYGQFAKSCSIREKDTFMYLWLML